MSTADTPFTPDTPLTPGAPAAPVTLVLEGCAVVTMDGQGSEYASGHVVVTGNVITAVGPGSPPPASLAGTGTRTRHRQAHRR